jgi:hypothetical protein
MAYDSGDKDSWVVLISKLNKLTTLNFFLFFISVRRGFIVIFVIFHVYV